MFVKKMGNNGSSNTNQDNSSQLKEIEIEVEQSESSANNVTEQTMDELLSQETHQDMSRERDSSYQLTKDRARRKIKPPIRYGHADLISYALSVAEKEIFDEPRSLKEALASNERDQWLKSMESELNSLKKNNTWILVDRPVGQRFVGNK